MDARDRRMREAVGDAVEDFELDVEPAREPVHRPAKPLPSLLMPLAHVTTEDARDDLSRVQPARWRLRVHMHDPEAFEQALADGTAPSKGEDDDLHEYVCVRRAVPVGHCVPDVLTWLQRQGVTGAVVLEWLPPNDGKNLRPMRHFVHIPEGTESRRQEPAAPPVMKPVPAGNGDLVGQMFERMQAESAELRNLVREISAANERLLTGMSEQHRHTINDLRDAFNEQLANDPRRKIGELVEQRVTQRVVEEIGGPQKDPFERLADELQKIENTKTKLGRFFSDPEKRAAIDPLEEKITNAVTDLALLYGKQKLGIPVGGGDAMNLAKQLGDLNTQGDALLRELEGEAA